MKKVNDALAKLAVGFNCAQSVLATYGPNLGLGKETALRAAEAFGGGMGHLGDTCGAVTGAFIVIGLKHGRIKGNDFESRKKTIELVRSFVKQFKDKNSSTICRELLGCDISSPEEYERAKEEGIFVKHCPGFVQSAVEILEKIL